MSADFVVLGLGSNLNHPIQNLRQALAEIKKMPNCEVVNVSSIYESDAQVPDNSSALLLERARAIASSGSSSSNP